MVFSHKSQIKIKYFQKKMLNTASDLPIEVISTILSFLPALDLKSVSGTCKLLNQLCQSENIWSKRCWDEFKLVIPPSQGRTRRFFQKVLHKYGHLLGFWMTHADCYGGLLHVKYDDWKLLGVDMQLPKEPYITLPLRPRTLFIIDLDGDGEACIRCTMNPHKPHPCSLIYGQKQTMPYQKNVMEPVLTRQCANLGYADDHQILADSSLELERWLTEQSDFIEEFGLSRSQCLYKFLVLRQVEMKTSYSRLFLPLPLKNVPIQPGLFKGTYSAHGLELIKLFYDEDVKKVTAVKVTGDPNVPAGQITFRADLPYAMCLTAQQQRSIEDLDSIDPIMSSIPWNEMGPQPYIKPLNCLDSFRDVPTTCQSRFHGFGQIASSGFTDPSFVRGHWIIFNEDLFGFIWISLHAFSAYHRVSELSNKK